MQNTTSWVKALVLGAAFLTAACTAQTESRLENNHQTRVDLTRFQNTVDTDTGTGMPTTTGYRDAAAFLVSLRTGFGDVVMIRGGSAEGRRSLVEGLEGYYRSVEFVTLPGGGGDLSMIVERAIATPPSCGDWSSSSGHDSTNNAGRDFGCSTEASLGLMVADPRDLQFGDAPGPNSSSLGVRAIGELYTGPLILTPPSDFSETTE